MSKWMISLGWLTLLAAAGAFGLHFYIQSLQRSKRDWPVASARVESSSIVRTERASLVTSLTSTAPNREARYRMVPVWAIATTYTFRVGEETIEGHTATLSEYAAPVRPGETRPGPDMVALVERLPAGAVVPAHYQPGNPQENYLIYLESPGDRSALWTALVLLGAGVLLIGLPSILQRRARGPGTGHPGLSGLK